MSEKKMGAPLRFPALSGDPIRDRVIKLRRRLGISQAALGARLGVTDAAVGQWEKGERIPSAMALNMIGVIEDIERQERETKKAIKAAGGIKRRPKAKR